MRHIDMYFKRGDEFLCEVHAIPDDDTDAILMVCQSITFVIEKGQSDGLDMSNVFVDVYADEASYETLLETWQEKGEEAINRAIAFHLSNMSHVAHGVQMKAEDNGKIN